MSFDHEWGSNRFQNRTNQAGKQKTITFHDSFLTRHVGHLTRFLMARGAGFEPATNWLHLILWFPRSVDYIIILYD